MKSATEITKHLPEAMNKKQVEQTVIIIQLGELLQTGTVYINGIKAQGVIRRFNELQAAIDAETKEYFDNL